jgi:hypothetical protein
MIFSSSWTHLVGMVGLRWAFMTPAPRSASPAWEGWISPDNLTSLVRNTAPFLYPQTPPPARSARLADLLRDDIAAQFAPGERPSSAFLSILYSADVHNWAGLTFEEQLIDYFALCLACHHATVATFVPTDVDSKIRGLIWRKTRDRETLRALANAAFAMARWDLGGVSKRTTEIGGLGPVSGHDGEWLSVMAGGHGRFLELRDTEFAGRTAEAIDSELKRELEAFQIALSTRGAELDTLRLAASITHNLGDLDQGISFWEGRAAAVDSLKRFHRLAHENKAAYGGGFQAPADLYKKALATEGHRHYPLRAVKALRQSAELLLPLGPYLDDWGATIASFPAFNSADRAEVIDALVRGCRKIPGQQGYFRALAGMSGQSTRAFEDAVALLPSASRKDLRSPETRRLMAVPRGSFESRLRKFVHAAAGH